MALFNKKKPPEAAPAPASAPSDDFSDFSPEALAASGDSTAAADSGKGKAKAAKPEKPSAPVGYTIKPGVAVGLNIGNDSIKVVEASAKGNEITITGMGMVPTPVDSIANGVVMSANALAAGIRDAMAQAGIKSKKVVTSIAGTGALVVRIIEVPKMSDGELLDNMKMDADRYIPFPPSEVEMDFKALRDLPSDPDAANMEVLLAAAQREVIDLHVQVVQEAKLDPRAIDVEPLAAARALTSPFTNRHNQGMNGNGATANGATGANVDYSDVSAILNIGASGTEISILRGDILVFTRTVPTGGNVLTQALVDTLGLAWSDAEQLKRQMGDALAPTIAGGTPEAGGTAATTPAGNSDWSEDSLTADSGAADDWSAFGDNSDPVNTEPGEQHQQKEPNATPPAGEKINAEAEERDLPSNAPASEPTNEPASVPPSASTFFNFGTEDEPEEKIPTLHEGKPTSFADLVNEPEEDLSELPTLTPDAPPVATLPSAFDFPESQSPTASSPTASSPASTASAGAPAATSPVITPPPAESAAAPPQDAGAFAFNLDDSPATPSATTEIAASDAVTEQPAAAGGFGFDFETPAATEATEAPAPAIENDPFAEFMASAGEPTTAGEPASPPAAPTTEAAAAPSTPATPGVTAEANAPADDFDLDSLFGGAAAGTAAAGVAAGAAGAATTTAAPGATDSLDLDDFGLGTATASRDDFSADLADFGAGLGGATAGEIDAQTLHSVLDPVLETLVNEVRRSLEYHTTRYPEAAVRRVTVIGGGAKLKNLDAYLTQKLGLPTAIGNPVARVNVRAPKLPPGYGDENGPLFTVALGLAMRELTK